MRKLILGFALAFTIGSCAKAPPAETEQQKERDLRAKKGDMMREMDEGTAASESNSR